MVFSVHHGDGGVLLTARAIQRILRDSRGRKLLILGLVLARLSAFDSDDALYAGILELWNLL